MFLKVFVGISFTLCGILPYGLGEEYPPEEVKEYFKQFHDTCVKKLGVPDDISKNYDFSNKSPEVMCYMKCLMEELELIGIDEVAFYDKIINDAPIEIRAHVERMVNGCRNIPEATRECERTYNLFACAYKVDPEHFYMP